jgi:hypothetical protein
MTSRRHWIAQAGSMLAVSGLSRPGSRRVWGDDTEAAARRLERAKVDLTLGASHAHRTSLYNNESDVDALLNALS